MKKTMFILLLAFSSVAWARVEAPEGQEPIAPEPNVTIVDDTNQIMHIHQINGKVYGIRVIPKSGKPYNLVDPNGEGNFIRSPAEKILIPEWVLLKW